MRAASAATLDRGGDAAVRAWLALRALALRLDEVRPVFVVAPLVALQWALVLWLALHVPHNAWLYYSGGDSTEYWAHEWALAHGLIPNATLGYAVPIAFAWVPRIFGASALVGLPAIVLVQTVVLLPLAVAAVWALANRIAGRVFAAFAAYVWAIAPIVSIPLWRVDYHDRYVDRFLPQLYGLVNLGDFPSLIVLLGLACFTFRALDDGRGNDAVVAGLLAGLAVGVKPANALVVPAPLLALAVARRFRLLPLYVACLAPAVVTLALWKDRGLGHLPLLSEPAYREAAGTHVPGLSRVGHYLDFSRARLDYNLGQLREYFWSRLLVEFLALAGLFAVFRKSTAKALYLLVWFGAFFVVKIGNPAADMRAGSLLRLAMPGLPAFFLLAAAVVLLVPGWGRRRSDPPRAGEGVQPTVRLGLAVALLAVLPLVFVGVAKPAPVDKIARIPQTTIDTPITNELDVTATQIADGVRIRWRPVATGGAKVFYIVFRSLGLPGTCAYTGTGGDLCVLKMSFLGRTALTKLDDTPFPGHYQYRVAVAASFKALDADLGDATLLSPPVAFNVSCTRPRCFAVVERILAERAAKHHRPKR